MYDFLEELLLSTTEGESPQSFLYWSGLCVLSAVVKNNVCLNKYIYTLYPNIYVLLFAKSGLRKGVPINTAKRLVAMTNNTRVIAGRSSVQGIIKELATARCKPDGTVLKDACGFIASSEFASSLVQDPAALTILTDLYDSNFNEEWTNMLKGSPVEELKNINVTLLGGINQAHFQDSVPDSALMGGFIGRTFIIYEEKKRCVNSLVYAPKKVPDFKEMAAYLKEVAKLKGEFKYTEAGGQFYDQWYKTYNTQERDDKTGTLERIHDSILKVAMLISVSRKTDLTLDEIDLQEAVTQCMVASSAVRRVTIASGKSPAAPQIAMVLKELITRKTVTRMKLLQCHYGDFDAIDLDRIVETLIQAGAVTSKKEGRDTLYEITQKALDQLKTGD
mgnify:FL=1